MTSHSTLLAERYELHLTQNWTVWFDQASQQLRLPGMMRQIASVADLCQPAPELIWPGFMLPDSLPLIGNRYGDWICGRIDEAGTIRELIYWFHGGGDWIPVGTSVAESVLHDAVDQFRSEREQMLRGATESRIDSQAGVLLRLDSPEIRGWLAEQLSSSEETKVVASTIDGLVNRLSQWDHLGALQLLRQQGWAQDAVCCDLLEACLQTPIAIIASKEIAKRINAPWFPEYVGLLFDTDQIGGTIRRKIADAAEITDDAWPQQDWELAGEIAETVCARRQDLGWATAIAGWHCERTQQYEQAVEIYTRGLQASSFSDQSVRFNAHADSEEHGKFAAARLGCLREKWPASLHENNYLQLLLGERTQSLLAVVSEYWKKQAQDRESAGDFAAAYHAFWAWGWDLGVSRLTDYEDILRGLSRCASQAGWAARAVIAETHLRCLQRST